MVVNYQVEKRKNERTESMIARFTKGVMNSKILKEYRNRSRFMTPRQKKKAKLELAKIKIRR